MFFRKKCKTCGSTNSKDAIHCVSCGGLLVSGEVMVLDSGYLSPDFITTPKLMEAVIQDAYILITDKKISDVADLLAGLEKTMQLTENILVVAEDVDGEALATMVAHKLQGTLNVLAIKASGTEGSSKTVLQDIADFTGGTVISGRKLE